MSDLFTSPAVISVTFLTGGLMAALLIVKHDKHEKRKMNTLQQNTGNTKILYKDMVMEYQPGDLPVSSCKHTRRIVSNELDHLVWEFDNGYINLPDYCNRLNTLLEAANNN